MAWRYYMLSFNAVITIGYLGRDSKRCIQEILQLRKAHLRYWMRFAVGGFRHLIEKKPCQLEDWYKCLEWFETLMWVVIWEIVQLVDQIIKFICHSLPLILNNPKI